MTSPERMSSMPPAAGGLRRSDLSTDLAAAVVRMISIEKLAPGRPIPPLRPLAQRFGVAVPTMREALRRLEGLGILEFRHGSGIFVGANANRLVLANVLAPHPSREQLCQLLQARLVIEPPIAAMAAGVRDADGIDRLRAALAEAQRQVQSGDPRLPATNSDIHRGIAAATGNPVLAQTIDSLATVHAQEQAEILVLHGDAEQDFDEHARIVRHVAGGDVDAARMAMHEHLTGVLDVVSAQLSAPRTPEVPERPPPNN